MGAPRLAALPTGRAVGSIKVVSGEPETRQLEPNQRLVRPTAKPETSRIALGRAPRPDGKLVARARGRHYRRLCMVARVLRPKFLPNQTTALSTPVESVFAPQSRNRPRQLRKFGIKGDPAFCVDE